MKPFRDISCYAYWSVKGPRDCSKGMKIAPKSCQRILVKSLLRSVESATDIPPLLPQHYDLNRLSSEEYEASGNILLLLLYIKDLSGCSLERKGP